MFVFTSTLGAWNVDRITDDKVLAERIEINNAAFVGPTAGAATAVGTAAQVINETDTSFLWFERDESGATYAAVHFATLDTKPATLGASVVVVV